MKLPLPSRLRRLRTRGALPPELRARLRALRGRREQLRTDREALAQPLALARLAVVDLETTGPRMATDGLIAIGAVAVHERTVRHEDAFERVLRQAASSSVENILVHRIGGQQQLGGVSSEPAMLDFLEWLGASVAVAFRAEFDATVLARELESRLGIVSTVRFVDLALVLPALFPNLQNDSLDDWILHFRLPAIDRHHALADAYATAQLTLLVLDGARRAGLATVGDLVELERAQRWLGKRR